jgi:hypothetical protein
MKRSILGIGIFGCAMRALSLACSLVAQTQVLISISSEPHHHLQMHNSYVNVYHAQLRPHESMLLHKHDYDYMQVAIGDAQLVRIVPGQPEAVRSIHDGQVDFGTKGTTHASRNDTDSTYNTIAVEFLRPQGDVKNGCVTAVAGKPLNCVAGDASHGQLQFQTDSTSVYSTVIPSQKAISLDSSMDAELVVALDDMRITVGSAAAKTLHPGDFAWIEKGKPDRVIENASDKDIRVVEIVLQP